MHEGTIDQEFSADFRHRLLFCADEIGAARPLARRLLPDERSPCRVFVDDGVFAADPRFRERLGAYLDRLSDRLELRGEIRSVPGGERCKNDRAVLDDILAAIHEGRLCRRSFVLAIGGGAVLDVVGFAAAISHRGVRLLRYPTTTLGQSDSGVGVKNGVNAFGVKNYLGSFATPWGVVHDYGLLSTLEERDWICGFAEAVKVALVRDASFFGEIERRADEIRRRLPEAAAPVLRRSAELHYRHIVEGGDPFESLTARPLDFGHWSAHRIEQVTDFRVRHGEAVALGIAVDCAYAARIGMLASGAAQRVYGCLRRLGFRLEHEVLESPDRLLDGLDEFREHLGGPLTISLLQAIGTGVDVHSIDRPAMIEAIGGGFDDGGGR